MIIIKMYQIGRIKLVYWKKYLFILLMFAFCSCTNKYYVASYIEMIPDSVIEDTIQPNIELFCFNSRDSLFFASPIYKYVSRMYWLEPGQSIYDSLCSCYIQGLEENGVKYTHILDEGQDVKGPFLFFKESNTIYLKGTGHSSKWGDYLYSTPILSLDSANTTEVNWDYLAFGSSNYVDGSEMHSRYNVVYSGRDTIIEIGTVNRRAHLFYCTPGHYFRFNNTEIHEIIFDAELLIPLKFVIYSANQRGIDTRVFKVNRLFLGSKLKQARIKKTFLYSEISGNVQSRWTSRKIVLR